MTAIQIKDGDGITEATRRAMADGYQRFRKYLESKINQNVLIQPDGSCIFRDPRKKRRGPLSGHVCGPDGVPVVVAEIVEHNRQNRARIYDRVRGWERAMKIGLELQIYGVAFSVRRYQPPDVVALDPLYPISKDHDWERWFSECIGRWVVHNGFTFVIQDVFLDQLHLRVVGK